MRPTSASAIFSLAASRILLETRSNCTLITAAHGGEISTGVRRFDLRTQSVQAHDLIFTQLGRQTAIQAPHLIIAIKTAHNKNQKLTSVDPLLPTAGPAKVSKD